MGIKVEVRSYSELLKAIHQLRDLLWRHDLHPESRRTKWYKKRHDYYLKPSIRRRRRKHTVDRKRRGNPLWCHFSSLDGDYLDWEEL